MSEHRADCPICRHYCPVCEIDMRTEPHQPACPWPRTMAAAGYGFLLAWEQLVDEVRATAPPWLRRFWS